MNQLYDNPIDEFAKVFTQAQNNSSIKEPTAFCLATVSAGGRPSNRMLLLKGFSYQGFVFYTNTKSRKGRDLSSNLWAAMCFYWQSIGRQIRIEGRVCRVSDQDADAYFASRPRDSCLGAWASKQSQELASTDKLQQRLAHFEKLWLAKEVLRPDYWHGYCLEPKLLEFWSEGKNRLHQRIEYYLDLEKKWQHRMLFP